MGIQEIVLYCSLFISLFFEVFLLITYLEVKEEIKREETVGDDLAHFPTVTIIVPSYNEQDTISATVNSLLALDYPKDKFSLILVDDGSKDKTWEVMQSFESNPQVRAFRKENGGKYTALNFALERVESEFVGCLDADSFVAPYALKRIIPYFDDPKVMAVTPAVKVHEPKTVLQYIQRVEYSWGIFLRRMLSAMDAMYVTPGPFSIFRTQVFKEIGGYLHAHHTEDMEIALRMQKNRYKIVNSPMAHVYTVTPANLKNLYTQRVRWAYGFLNNAFDYRHMYFNRQYGHIGIFILPIATLSIFTTIYAAGHVLSKFGGRLSDMFTEYRMAGFNPEFDGLHFDWYFLNTNTVSILALGAFSLSLVIIFFALRMADGKFKFRKEILYYLVLYMFIVPLWQAKAIYSTIFKRRITWR
jgi:cellulose synthase/poly-beta-1,6-N-acetylglucosamine synthase-like glycosyltransferase